MGVLLTSNTLQTNINHILSVYKTPDIMGLKISGTELEEKIMPSIDDLTINFLLKLRTDESAIIEYSEEDRRILKTMSFCYAKHFVDEEKCFNLMNMEESFVTATLFYLYH